MKAEVAGCGRCAKHGGSEDSRRLARMGQRDKKGREARFAPVGSSVDRSGLARLPLIGCETGQAVLWGFDLHTGVRLSTASKFTNAKKATFNGEAHWNPTGLDSIAAHSGAGECCLQNDLAVDSLVPVASPPLWPVRCVDGAQCLRVPCPNSIHHRLPSPGIFVATPLVWRRALEILPRSRMQAMSLSRGRTVRCGTSQRSGIS